MAKLELKVSVEKVIHDAFSEMAQRIFDEHGVIVNSVSIDWRDMSGVSKSAFQVAGSRIDSECKIYR